MAWRSETSILSAGKSYFRRGRSITRFLDWKAGGSAPEELKELVTEQQKLLMEMTQNNFLCSGHSLEGLNLEELITGKEM